MDKERENIDFYKMRDYKVYGWKTADVLAVHEDEFAEEILDEM